MVATAVAESHGEEFHEGELPRPTDGERRKLDLSSDLEFHNFDISQKDGIVTIGDFFGEAVTVEAGHPITMEVDGFLSRFNNRDGKPLLQITVSDQKTGDDMIVWQRPIYSNDTSLHVGRNELDVGIDCDPVQQISMRWIAEVTPSTEPGSGNFSIRLDQGNLPEEAIPVSAFYNHFSKKGWVY